MTNRIRSLFLAVALVIYGLLLWNDPQTTYKVFIHRAPVADGVSFAGWNFLALGFMAAGLLVTAVLGSALTHRILVDAPVSAVTRHVAGFAVGYTAMCAILRLVSLVLPIGSIFVITCLAALLAAWLSCGTARWDARTTTYADLFAAGATWAALLLVLLCSQVYMNEFHWVGHGPMQYAFFLWELRHANQPTYFPIIPQHVDELLFTLFLTDLVPASCDAIVAAWMTLAAVKVSTAALVLCLLLKLHAGRLWAGLGAAYVMFGTTAIDPFKYIGLFDSFNPLAFTVHSGRVIGVALTFLLATDVLTDRRPVDLTPSRRLRPMTHMAAALLGSGLACSSLSNLALLIPIVATAWAARIRNESHPARVGRGIRIERGVWTAALLSAILVCPIAYGLLSLTGEAFPQTLRTGQVLIVSGGFLLVAVTATGIMSIMALARTPRLLLAPYTTRLIAFVLAGTLTCLTVVNVPCDNAVTRGLLGRAHANHLLSHLQITNPFGSHRIATPERPLLFVDAREIAPWTQYNLGALHFASAYALILFAAAGAHLSLIRTSAKTVDTPLYGWWAINCAAISVMPLLFFFTDFVFDGNRAWVKTRFLEIPVYCVLFSCLLACARIQGRGLRAFMAACVGLYIVLPILGTHRLAQWCDNARLLWRLLRETAP